MYEVKEIVETQEVQNKKKMPKILLISLCVFVSLFLVSGVFLVINNFFLEEPLFDRDSSSGVGKDVPNLFVSNVVKNFGEEPFLIEHSTNSDGLKSFNSSDMSVAKVENSGLVTIQGSGTTTITFRVEENENFVSKSTSAVLTVEKISQDTDDGLSAISKPVLGEIVSGSSTNITWDMVQTASDGYEVEILRDRSGASERINPRDASINQAVISSSGLEVGDRVKFRVRASETDTHLEGQWSPFSNEVAVIVGKPQTRHAPPSVSF